MATIKDIARLSGAGIATVSRVVNNKGYVADTTRKRIEQAINELGYRPNAGARMIRSGRSHLIGVLVPSIKVDFFARLAHRLEQALFVQGYQTLICSTAEDLKHESEYINMLLAQQVDGVMVASVSSNVDVFSKLVDANIPILALDRQLDGIGAPLVSADHFAGGQMAAEHLIGLGHTKISVVGAPIQSQSVQQRVAGAILACQEEGLSSPEIVLGTDHRVKGCAELAMEVLVRSPRPTAIIAISDIAAIGILHAARAKGITVPDELSVTGFDDTPLAAYVFPAVTTIAQPIDQIAQTAISSILAMISSSDKAVPDDVILPVSLSLRQSTARAP